MSTNIHDRWCEFLGGQFYVPLRFCHVWFTTSNCIICILLWIINPPSSLLNWFTSSVLVDPSYFFRYITNLSYQTEYMKTGVLIFFTYFCWCKWHLLFTSCWYFLKKTLAKHFESVCTSVAWNERHSCEKFIAQTTMQSIRRTSVVQWKLGWRKFNLIMFNVV